MPPSIEERVAYLEGKVEEHSHGVREMRELIVQVDGRVAALDRKVDRFRDELAARIDGVDGRLSARIDGLTARIDGLESHLSARIDGLESHLNVRIDGVEGRLSARIDGLDRKMSRQFTWLVGIQVAVLLTLIGGLFQG